MYGRMRYHDIETRHLERRKKYSRMVRTLRFRHLWIHPRKWYLIEV